MRVFSYGLHWMHRSEMGKIDDVGRGDAKMFVGFGQPDLLAIRKLGQPPMLPKDAALLENCAPKISIGNRPHEGGHDWGVIVQHQDFVDFTEEFRSMHKLSPPNDESVVSFMTHVKLKQNLGHPNRAAVPQIWQLLERIASVAEKKIAIHEVYLSRGWDDVAFRWSGTFRGAAEVRSTLRPEIHGVRLESNEDESEFPLIDRTITVVLVTASAMSAAIDSYEDVVYRDVQAPVGGHTDDEGMRVLLVTSLTVREKFGGKGIKGRKEILRDWNREWKDHGLSVEAVPVTGSVDLLLLWRAESHWFDADQMGQLALLTEVSRVVGKFIQAGHVVSVSTAFCPHVEVRS